MKSTLARQPSPSPPMGRQPRGGRWRLTMVVIASTTGALLLFQAIGSTGIQSIQRRWFGPNSSAYSYPFELTKTSRSLEAGLSQEIAFYQGRLRLNPSSALDLAALAGTYLQLARLTGEDSWYLLADQTAQQSLALLPFNNDGALAILARVAEARHDFKTTLQLAGKIVDQREAAGLQATANLALGNLPAAAAAGQQLVDLTPSMGAYTTLALIQTAQGQDAAAIASFEAGLSLEEWGEVNGSARARTLFGRFYYERGQLDQAEGLYREALYILPDYPPALLNLAQLHLRRGQYGAAQKLYQRLMAAADGDFTVYTPLLLRGQARIAQLQGDQTAAQAHWQQAEALLLPDSAAASSQSFGHRRDLARLRLERQASGDVAAAVALMQVEVRDRQDTETLQTYAAALAAAERWQAAQEVVQQALAADVNSADLLYQAGQIEQALGRSDEAEAYFQKALKIDPAFDQAARQALNLGVGLGS